jgi:DNA-binding CsgD family transcriptional regulator
MDSGDRLLGLIERLYAAPGTVDGWNLFLESLRTAVHGSTAHLISHDLRSHRGDMAANAGADLDGLHQYEKYWSAFDPWAYSPQHTQLRSGSVTVGDALVEHAHLKRTAFYTDFARHYDLVRIIGGVIEASPAAASVLSVARSERQQPFDDADVTLLTALVPHVQRALQLHRRFIESHAAVDDLTAVLERSSRVVLLLDAAGRITFMTGAASRLLARRDGLTTEQRELWAANRADRTRLRAAVADAVNTSEGAGFAPAGVVTLGRRSGRSPLIVLVSPVARQRSHFPGVESAAAIVFVKDPDQIAIPGHETLQTLFGLTAGEAKLARLLAEGCTLQDAGAQLGLRRETARSRLKTIFEKTDTHRQAELVLRVLNGSPPL